MENLNLLNTKYAIEMLRKHGVSNGGTIGFHAGWCDIAADQLESALALINELTEENERLKSVEFTCGFIKPHKVLECPIFDEIARTKADTVRKMQEKLTTFFENDDYIKCVEVDAEYINEQINNVTKEMLEGV